MKIRSLIEFSQQKMGNTVEECEDSHSFLDHPERLVCAVADGASQGYYSKVFSRLLCEEFTNRYSKKKEGELFSGFEAFLDQVRILFDEEIKKINKDKEIKWYEENSIKNGSFSTFAGLVIEKKRKECYVVIVGDCFIFHRNKSKRSLKRSKKKLSIYPKSYGVQDNTPYLLSTNKKNNSDLVNNIYKCRIKLSSNGDIIIATDAISYYIIDRLLIKKQKGKDTLVYDNLLYNADNERKVFFEKCITEKLIKNDDITYICISYRK